MAKEIEERHGERNSGEDLLVDQLGEPLIVVKRIMTHQNHRENDRHMPSG